MLKNDILDKHIKSAYLYSSQEEYLLSLMNKYASTYGEEIEDEDLGDVHDKALDHNGNTMVWYSKAQLSNDLMVSVGGSVNVQQEDKIELAHVLSITDKGVYLKLANNSEDVLFGTVSLDSGKLHYDVVAANQDEDEGASYYLAPQYGDKDLNYKEKVNSLNFKIVRKRAQFILNRLDNTFPVAMWSVRITNSDGEDIEVIDNNEC